MHLELYLFLFLNNCKYALFKKIILNQINFVTDLLMMESGDQSLWIVKYHFVLFFPHSYQTANKSGG